MAPAPAPDDELSSKALQKRYDGLVAVKNKAVKGKGAWYWVHLEPILVQNQSTGSLKAVKLRCGLCSALFSASNPSRTASEHLKRGTCPNFNGIVPKPLASAHPPSTGSRKRSAHVLPAPPLALPAPTSMDEVLLLRGSNGVPPLILSGGKEDLGALALLEDNVKKLKSPSAGMSPSQGLSRGQVESAINLLAEWVYESCGTVSFSCVEHPKFRAFVSQVGLPPISGKYLAGPKLEAKFQEVRNKSEVRLQDAKFFQVASDGWWKRATITGETLINVTLNLPNGTSLFYKVLTLNCTSISSKITEDILWGVINGVSGNTLERCVGIVADSDKQILKALQELELRNSWMVNIPCQIYGFSSLLKSFHKHLTFFRTIDSECRKIIDFFASKPAAWSYLQKLQVDSFDTLKLLRTLPPPSILLSESSHYLYAISIAEDIAGSARVLQMAGMDESFKMAYADDPLGREVLDMISGMSFWSDLEAVLSLIKLVKVTLQDLEVERPSVSQCLPMWVDFRTKVKDWCVRYDKNEGSMDQVIEKRFSKNYHPAWSAAFVLDPLYLIRDPSGKYLPPFKCLTAEQEKDVDRLITRLVSRDEAPVALMELLKWRANGLDPLYAQAIQMKERNLATGKLRPVTPQSRRLIWETCLSEFKVLGKVAVRLIFLHATSSNLKCSWSMWKWVYRNGNTRAAMERAEKVVHIASQVRLDQKEFVGEEEKDVDLFSFGGGDFSHTG